MILTQINLIFTGKVLHVSLFLKVRVFENRKWLILYAFSVRWFFSKSVGNNCPSGIRMFSFQYITFLTLPAGWRLVMQSPSVINDAIIKRAAKAKINWLFIFQDNRKYSSAFICT